MLQWFVSQKRVISTEEIQFNHKPAKMLLTEKKKGVSQNGQTPGDPVVVFPLGRWCPPQETSQPHPPPHQTGIIIGYNRYHHITLILCIFWSHPLTIMGKLWCLFWKFWRKMTGTPLCLQNPSSADFIYIRVSTLVITVLADALVPKSARPLAATVLT